MAWFHFLHSHISFKIARQTMSSKKFCKLSPYNQGCLYKTFAIAIAKLYPTSELFRQVRFLKFYHHENPWSIFLTLIFLCVSTIPSTIYANILPIQLPLGNNGCKSAKCLLHWYCSHLKKKKNKDRKKIRKKEINTV